MINVASAEDLAPEFISISDKTVEEGEELVFTIIAIDADSPTPIFNFGVNPTSDYYSLPTGNNAVLRDITGDTKEFHWTPQEGWAGVYEVRFTASDGTYYNYEDVLITVTGSNHTPDMGAVEDKIVIWGDELVFEVPVTHIDIHDDLEFTAHLKVASGFSYSEILPDGVGFHQGTGVFSWIPDVGVNSGGDYVFRFCVTDGSETDCEHMTVTVADSYPVVVEEEVVVEEVVVEEEVVEEEVVGFAGFPDVGEENAHYDAIIFVGEMGIFEGDGNTGNFSPNRFINRAEVAKVVMEAFSQEIMDAPQGDDFGFSDLTIGAWYMDYIYTAFELGVMIGTGDGTMKPERTVSKAEFLKILLEIAGVELQKCTGDWYCKYVEFAQANALIETNVAGTFNPADGMTRADVAELLYLYDQMFGSISASA